MIKKWKITLNLIFNWKILRVSILLSCLTVGSLFSQTRWPTTQITNEFFGVDFWGYSAQLWPQFFTLLEEDSLRFGLIGLGLGWEELEPDPPYNGEHTYNWSAIDNIIGMVVASGCLYDLNLLCRSNWATIVPFSEMNEQCCDMSPPKEDAASDTIQWGMTAYQAWNDFVFNFVERYDADGVDDAPGITDPAILYLQLGDEPDLPGHFIQYGGTPEIYDRMLEIMYNAAKSANPNITVVRGKSNPGNMFDDDPDSTILYSRRGDYLDFISTTLQLGENHFDVFAINFNDHYTGLFPFVRWLNTEMQNYGYSKPFMVADARTTAYPRAPEDSVQILPPRYLPGFIESLRDTSHPLHETNRRLSYADEARQSLRKLLVAIASGQKAISLQPVAGPVIHQLDLWQDAGLIDVRVWQTTEYLNLNLARKPVYYAAEQLMDIIVGADKEVEILDLGPNVYAYRFTKQWDTFYILWHEDPFDVDDLGLVRREQQVSIDLTAYISTSQVRMKYFVSELDSNYAPIYLPDSILAMNNITIDETPVLIEALMTTSVMDSRETVPKEFILYQNYPNPFNPTTTITFSILRQSYITLKVFDVLGREVTTLVEGELNPGEHSVVFNAQNLASGLYFYQLKSEHSSRIRKFVLIQ